MNLEIKNITKQYKDKLAVDHVNLNLTSGVWGLLGANGAGKTTLMRMIADIMQPTSGCILYNGNDIHKMGNAYREKFGFLPQEFGYGKDFNVIDYLEYIAALKDIPKTVTKRRIDELLEILTLTDVRKKRIDKLSGGMKRRVGIAQAMLNEPEILVLDEPTAGLDPGERIRFRNFISEFSNNRIVLISTHIVSDIEYIAKKTAILKNGKILNVGTTDELAKQIEGKVWNCTVSEKELLKCEANLRIINQRHEENGRVLLRYLADEKQIEHSINVEPRLEDLYLWLFPQTNQEE